MAMKLFCMLMLVFVLSAGVVVWARATSGGGEPAAMAGQHKHARYRRYHRRRHVSRHRHRRHRH